MKDHDLTRRDALRGLAGATVLATVPVGTTLGQTVKSNFKDEDDNGIPDEGEVVTGTYKSLYAYDANGDWYWDLGDGRVQGTVDSVNALDQSTLTTCDYKVQYRGKFENDPFLDSGWVKNNINCKGYDDDGNYNYIIVHETDPRYTGTRPSIWGDWEYHVDVESGVGNKLAGPKTPQ
ncbi:hypothetical protein [Halorussus ruber]|uniref:hypothetical protein n=1 Tax=Halorussus ruber TaxID=1126238 RepID=UPI001B2FF44A|nr:hypothetical protein [Halorussus ruber]